GADLVALGEVLVAPDVDDLIERPDLGVPERSQLGILLPGLVGFAEALLDFGDRVRLYAVSPDLIEHGALIFRSETMCGRLAAIWPALPDGHSTAKRVRLPVATL